MTEEVNFAFNTMSEISSLDDLLSAQRKEKKELMAKTQKMKHGVPKGDKKKKKEVTAEITQLLADLDLKHEKELQEFESSASSVTHSDEKPESEEDTDKLGCVGSPDSLDSTYVSTDKDENVKAPQRLSKAQKRRNKKAALEKERIRAIADQEIENLSGLRHVESEEIKKKLSDRNLTIYEIPSDGNCLYKAVEHQLFSLNLKQMTAQSLREMTSQYMLSHMEDFIPFLTCPETGDVLSEEQYVKYCEDIATTCAWGGHIEVQALSHICGLPIEIIQAQGPSIITGDEKSSPKLILSYHRHVYGLGEHYNSVVPATE